MKLSAKIKRLRWAGLVAACALSTAFAGAPATSAPLPTAWGSNYSGQLGDGTNTNRDVPVAVDASGVLAGKTVTAISAGNFYSLALTSDGKVYGWGDNGYGQLGDGTTTRRHVPVAVNTSGVLAGETVTAISAGAIHSLALTSDGRVYAWGDNGQGQLGDGTTTDHNVPVAVNTSGVLAGKTVTTISAGLFYSLALASAPVCPTITVAPRTLIKGVVGKPYSKTITASGGTAPYRFELVAGALPGGLTLSGTGVVSGTPTAVGTFSFTVRATDANGCRGRRVHTIQICPLITVSPRTLVAGKVGVSYGQTFTANGGTAPYTFKIISGALPNGLTLTSGGALSGTPTASGDFTFTVSATATGGCTGKRFYTLHINP